MGITHFFSWLKKKKSRFLESDEDLRLLGASGLFDRDWYVSKYPDVAGAKTDPLRHYLRYGGFEGRDPGPNFSSRWYADEYQGPEKAGENPLVHYLKYGREQGHLPQPKRIQVADELYQCPACQQPVKQFLPLAPFYKKKFEEYGYPYTFDDAETLNAGQYNCPHCMANDRNRLYVMYFKERIAEFYQEQDQILLLDIAPSAPLSKFIDQLEKVVHHTADLFTENVDFALDITNMPEIASDSYDILVCSHVLEHVADDSKALSELYRVLKPGGWGILMVPIILAIDETDEDPAVIDPAERWRRFGQDDHVRLYSKRGFIQRVQTAGFRLKQLGVEHFGQAAFKRYGITEQSVLYIAEKP
jgi:SAM-dependent methyltransferase